MAYDFSGKVVLITGGTGALGRAVAQAFGTSNATTVVTYIIEEEREDVKSKIKTIAELVKADITKEDQAKKLVSHVIKTYDRIDVLVNVVGGYLGGKTVAELDETEWDKMMSMNLKSAFLISKHVIPLMVAAKHGKIVHISSRTGLKSDGYDSAYSASKSGLIRLVESISEEVKEHNINVNCILPSTIDTEANRNAMPNSDFSKWVKSEDLANLVLFLCSDEAKVINGAAIPAYGLA
ncbi:MAG TPA: SDR family NAD(P)-dependent oxidoreductase [Nitrososphaera sp.]|nr:SDR family NAD(P)-dependent oxidoreductase [Nitrososphaera sp.]